MLCNFVLTLYKNSPFINTHLLIKILLCKNMVSERFCVFQKYSFIKKNVEQSKHKEFKKPYHKMCQLRKFVRYKHSISAADLGFNIKGCTTNGKAESINGTRGLGGVLSPRSQCIQSYLQPKTRLKWQRQLVHVFPNFYDYCSLKQWTGAF